jgi:hypothetical protein
LVLAGKVTDSTYIVKRMLKLRDALWDTDKSNKKALNVTSDDYTVQLTFESKAKMDSIRNTMDYNRKVIKQFDISIIL